MANIHTFIHIYKRRANQTHIRMKQTKGKSFYRHTLKTICSLFNSVHIALVFIYICTHGKRNCAINSRFTVKCKDKAQQIINILRDIKCVSSVMKTAFESSVAELHHATN